MSVREQGCLVEHQLNAAAAAAAKMLLGCYLF